MILPGKKHVRLYQEAFARATERNEGDLGVDLLPAVLSALVVLIIGFACAVKTFEAINPRLSYPAQPIALDSNDNGIDRGIWFSLSAPGPNIVVTTDDQKIFEWPLDPLKALQSKGYVDFKDYLKDRRRLVIENLILSMDHEGIEAKSRAVVAVDEHLTYAHFKPIMLALSGAGIRSYGFETRSDGD